MIAWVPETTAQAQEVASGTGLPHIGWVGPALSLITLGTILCFRYRDKRTHLKITYSVGKPEHPADINDIPEKLRPHEPALWITVFNRSKMNVRLNNVFIEIKRGTIIFEGLGALMTGDSPTILQDRPPGGHWIFYQPMSKLADTLKEHGCEGPTCFKLVVRDWPGGVHRKTVKIEDLDHWGRQRSL